MDYLYLHTLAHYRRDKIEYFSKVEFEMKCLKNCHISDVIDNIIKEKKSVDSACVNQRSPIHSHVQ